jgi:hypothetical protein
MAQVAGGRPLAAEIVSTYARANNTTSYVINSGAGVLVANSTTAGSVTFPSFTLPDGGTRAVITDPWLQTPTTGLNWPTACQAYVSLYYAAPTATVGDGGDWGNSLAVGGPNLICTCHLAITGLFYSDRSTWMGSVPNDAPMPGIGFQVPVGTPIYWSVIFYNPGGAQVTLPTTANQQFRLSLSANIQ